MVAEGPLTKSYSLTTFLNSLCSSFQMDKASSTRSEDASAQ